MGSSYTPQGRLCSSAACRKTCRICYSGYDEEGGPIQGGCSRVFGEVGRRKLAARQQPRAASDENMWVSVHTGHNQSGCGRCYDQRAAAAMPSCTALHAAQPRLCSWLELELEWPHMQGRTMG